MHEVGQYADAEGVVPEPRCQNGFAVLALARYEILLPQSPGPPEARTPPGRQSNPAARVPPGKPRLRHRTPVDASGDILLPAALYDRPLAISSCLIRSMKEICEGFELLEASCSNVCI